MMHAIFLLFLNNISLANNITCLVFNCLFLNFRHPPCWLDEGFESFLFSYIFLLNTF